MKKHIAQIITFLLVLSIAAVLPAMDHSKMGHDMVEGGEKAAQDAMDHSKMGHDMVEGGEKAAQDAMDHSKMGHDMVEGGKKGVQDVIDHSKMGHDMPGKVDMGKKWFRESHVKGHHFTYELIDMREKMKGMPGMKNTHHLMVYIKDDQGNNLGKAKVGYLIKGPGNQSQKAMCMGMGGGFGSDVNLGTPGTYVIKTKVAAGKTKIMDTFEYQME
ncbi:MAG: hypothetical protein JEZ12_21810 [Desulfobacterium sp.]|nr:hypothetical protein [Desulfobacterium sp.]